MVGLWLILFESQNSPGDHLVKLVTGEDVENMPDIQGQLRLVAERVAPALG